MNWLLLTSEFDFKKGLRAWARVRTIFSPDFNPDNSNSGSCNSTRMPSNYLFLFYKGKNNNHVTWSCYVCKALYTLKLLKNQWLSIFNTVNWILQLTPLTRTLAWSNCFSFPFMVRVTGVLLYLKTRAWENMCRLWACVVPFRLCVHANYPTHTKENVTVEVWKKKFLLDCIDLYPTIYKMKIARLKFTMYWTVY